MLLRCSCKNVVEVTLIIIIRLRFSLSWLCFLFSSLPDYLIFFFHFLFLHFMLLCCSRENVVEVALIIIIRLRFSFSLSWLFFLFPLPDYLIFFFHWLFLFLMLLRSTCKDVIEVTFIVIVRLRFSFSFLWLSFLCFWHVFSSRLATSLPRPSHLRSELW